MSGQGGPGGRDWEKYLPGRMAIDILVARWNADITENLLKGAEGVLETVGFARLDLGFEQKGTRLVLDAETRRALGTEEGSGDASQSYAGESPRRFWRVWRVPGTYELPLAAKLALYPRPEEKLARHARGLVALGCVIRGETPHFDLVLRECYAGLQRISLRENTPIGAGALAAETREQAVARSSLEEGGINRGAEASEAVLEMLALRVRMGAALFAPDAGT